ncbi:MAG: hypothetical protein HQK83_03385 [Fibrobacteria bacterium]|nr:hypothetical protein [Fibrobacteria bacterium]
MSFDDHTDNEFIKKVYDDTSISRIPISGIVKGYHILPYILVGPNKSVDTGSVKLSGEITVSPKLILSLNALEEKFEEIFDEPEPFMDKSLVSRSFSFKLLQKENKKVQNDNMSIERTQIPDKELLENVLDELDKKETLNTGVIWSPHPNFYPVSLEKFIVSILDKEFK